MYCRCIRLLFSVRYKIKQIWILFCYQINRSVSKWVNDLSSQDRNKGLLFSSKPHCFVAQVMTWTLCFVLRDYNIFSNNQSVVFFRSVFKGYSVKTPELRVKTKNQKVWIKKGSKGLTQEGFSRMTLRKI